MVALSCLGTSPYVLPVKAHALVSICIQIVLPYQFLLFPALIFPEKGASGASPLSVFCGHAYSDVVHTSRMMKNRPEQRDKQKRKRLIRG